MAKLIPILLACVLGSVWGYLEEDNWTNYQSLASYQSPASLTWPWQGVKKGILGRQGILSNLSPAQSAILAFVSRSTFKICFGICLQYTPPPTWKWPFVSDGLVLQATDIFDIKTVKNICSVVVVFEWSLQVFYLLHWHWKNHTTMLSDVR